MKIYLTYGFAMAVAGAVLVVVLYLAGLHSDPAKLVTAQIVGAAGGLIIGAICITLGIKARRAEVPPTQDFGYGRALGAGMMIALFASLFGIATTFLYATVINPGFREVIVQAQTQKFEARGMSAAQIEAAENMVRKMMSPTVQAGSGFFGGIAMGTLISLVTAAVLKRPAIAEPLDAPPALSQ